MLSNSGFAEGSGYGLYAENYAGGRWVQSTDRADLTWTSYSVNVTSVKPFTITVPEGTVKGCSPPDD